MNILALLVAAVLGQVQPSIEPKPGAEPDGANHKSACDASDSVACLAFAQELSLSSKRADVAHAFKLFKRACEAGVPAACQSAGGLLDSDALGKRRKIQAARLFERARASYAAQCAANDMRGCANLVEMAEAAQVPTSPQERALWDKRVRATYHAECSDRRPESCAALASYCSRRDDEVCFVEAHNQLCTFGAARSCCLIGRAYREGAHGLTLDSVRAARFLQGACEGGDPACCADASRALHVGSCEKAESVRRQRFLEMGCDGEDAECCADLASMFEDGVVPRDPQRAEALRRKACSLGLSTACLE